MSLFSKHDKNSADKKQLLPVDLLNDLQKDDRTNEQMDRMLKGNSFSNTPTNGFWVSGGWHVQVQRP